MKERILSRQKVTKRGPATVPDRWIDHPAVGAALVASLFIAAGLLALAVQ